MKKNAVKAMLEAVQLELEDAKIDAGWQAWRDNRYNARLILDVTAPNGSSWIAGYSAGEQAIAKSEARMIFGSLECTTLAIATGLKSLDLDNLIPAIGPEGFALVGTATAFAASVAFYAVKKRIISKRSKRLWQGEKVPFS
jgi:hypothetical protein